MQNSILKLNALFAET